MGKIGVFPASGRLGGSVYKLLLDIVDASNVVLISRFPEKISSNHIKAGVTARKADFEVPATFDGAFDGVSHLVLISMVTVEIESRVKAHKHAIDAAIKSGVSHIFYASFASGGDRSPTSVSYLMEAHLQTEEYLKSLAASSSISFTVIREGFYSESFPMYLGFPDLQNPGSAFKIPHNGSGPGIAWAKMDELGEATAKLVEQYYESGAAGLSGYKDQIVMLTGPKAYSLTETVEILSTALGKKVVIEEVDLEDYVRDPVVVKSLGPYGVGDVPRKWATSFEALKRGEAEVTSTRLEELLGRKPEQFEATVKAMAQQLIGT